MTCREVIDILEDFLDSLLTEDSGAELQAHLEGCAPCLVYLNTYRKTRELTRHAVAPPMPPEMKDRLRQFLLDKLRQEVVGSATAEGPPSRGAAARLPGPFASEEERESEEHLAVLLTEAAQGSQEALARLYDRTSAAVYGVALRILRNRPAAEEAVLDAYTQAFRQARAYDPHRGTPSAWLLTIARSRALDRLRVQQRQRQREEPLEEAGAVESGGIDPLVAMAERQSALVVRAALAALPVEQRTLIEITYFEGLSHSEIAGRLKLPLGTVKTRIRIGILALRHQLRARKMEMMP